MKNQTTLNHVGAGQLLVVCTLLLLCALATGTLPAQNVQEKQKPIKGGVEGVNKVAVQFVGTNIVVQADPEGPGFLDMVSARVRTVQTNDLLINVGLELDLETRVVSASSEYMFLEVRVFVDGEIASPDVVTLGNQSVQSGGANFRSQRLDAVSFNFLASGLPPGVHTILAKALLTGFGAGGGERDGLVGKGTMTVETVHVITDPSDIPTLN